MSSQSLKRLIFPLEEKGAIDSDLVDQMSAMYCVRWMRIKEKLEQGDFQLVEQILVQNYDDMTAFISQVNEFIDKHPTVEIA